MVLAGFFRYSAFPSKIGQGCLPCVSCRHVGTYRYSHGSGDFYLGLYFFLGLICTLVLTNTQVTMYVTSGGVVCFRQLRGSPESHAKQ
jgi:hypothetical protein